MDPLSASALVTLLSKIFNGVTDTVGSQLWESMTSMVRRVFGRRSTSVEAAKRLGERPGNPESIKALADALIADSERDPQAAAQLRRWVAEAERTIAQDASVTNTVTGTVQGNVVQARDIHGGITF